MALRIGGARKWWSRRRQFLRAGAFSALTCSARRCGVAGDGPCAAAAEYGALAVGVWEAGGGQGRTRGKKNPISLRAACGGQWRVEGWGHARSGRSATQTNRVAKTLRRRYGRWMCFHYLILLNHPKFEEITDHTLLLRLPCPLAILWFLISALNQIPYAIISVLVETAIAGKDMEGKR